MAWDKVDWKVWTHPDGDSFARCWVRLQETREATKIVDQLLDAMPAGPIMAKVPRIIKVPEGEAWVSTENPLGEMGYYVVSKGDLGPFRVKIRSRQLQQRLGRAVGAARRVRARHHHDPRQPLLHPRGHRPVMFAVDHPVLGRSRCCASSVARVAVLLPAGTIVYLFLFKMMSFMQSRLGPMEAGPYGSMQLFAEVGKWLQKEDTAPEEADTRIFKMAPLVVLVIDVPAGRRRAVRPRRLLHQLRGRHLLHPGRVVGIACSASSSPAGRAPTSTRCSAACAPPAS